MAAQSWASSSSPLKVTGYGSTGVGYGTWTVSSGSDGTRSRATAHLAYYNADNHKVFYKLLTYVNAGYCYTPQYLTCDVKYYSYGDNDSNHYNTGSSKVGSWTWITANSVTSTLPGNADYARGGLITKLDIPVRTDSSSSTWWTNGAAY